jgi:predicted nucleic acid-binding protein
MRVVSNTTPISELFKIGKLDLLRLVYGQLFIPEAVAHELRRAQTWPALTRIVDQSPWISVCPLTDPDTPQRLRIRYPAIHEGEATAIVLAKEINATRLLVDDKRARLVAHSEGLPLIGTVGVVLLACRLRRISTAEGQTILDRLYTGTAYISERLYRDASRRLNR